MMNTFVEKTIDEVKELSRRGQQAYAAEVARREQFERRRQLTAGIEPTKAERTRVEELQRELDAAIDELSKARLAFIAAEKKERETRTLLDNANRELNRGWHRNQLVNLSDPAIEAALGELRERWDDARHGGPYCSPKKTARTMAKIERLQKGIAEIEALRFDASIESVEQLEAVVDGLVTKYTGPESENE